MIGKRKFTWLLLAGAALVPAAACRQGPPTSRYGKRQTLRVVPTG